MLTMPRTNLKVDVRYILIALGLLLLLSVASLLPLHVFAAAPDVAIKIDASGAAPRQVEDSTVQAVARDYSTAWKNLGRAVDENRPDLLNGFVGSAREQATQLIASQKQNGLRQRYIDHGHNATVAFYSVDGSSMLVHDTAQIEIQQLDGSNVVHSEQVTLHYLALLTPAENSWKVRVLESVPGF